VRTGLDQVLVELSGTMLSRTWLGARRVPGRAITYVACCPVGDTEPIVASSQEVAEVRWVSLDEIDQLMPDLYRPARGHLTALLGGGAPPAD
jgi:hypothetical protein